MNTLFQPTANCQDTICLTQGVHPKPCQAKNLANSTQPSDSTQHRVFPKVREYPLQFAILKVDPKVAHIRHPLANVGLHPI
jgi:hypothetical protein